MADQKISTLLAQVSTVASVKATALGMSRIDKDASQAAERDHNAMRGVAKVSVSRLAGAEERIKDIRSIQGEARELLADMTTAWGERRLLPNSLLENFMVKWNALKKTFDEKVNILKYDAPRLIEEAERNKGSFDVDIPTEEEIRDAFTLEFMLEPVPDVGTYKATGMDKAVENELKRRFEENVKASYISAQQDAVHRLAKPLQNLVERMGAYNQREIDAAKGFDVGKAGYFRDSVIGNVQEIAEVFGSWNLTEDPIMQQLDDALGAFGGIEAADLRNNKDLRDDTTKRATEILDKIKAAGFL